MIVLPFEYDFLKNKEFLEDASIEKITLNALNFHRKALSYNIKTKSLYCIETAYKLLKKAVLLDNDLYISSVVRDLKGEIAMHGYTALYKLECDCLLAVAMMEKEGFPISRERWEALFKKKEADLYAVITKLKAYEPPTPTKCNFNALVEIEKLNALRLLDPFIQRASTPYLADYAKKADKEVASILRAYIKGDYAPLEAFLLNNYYSYVIEKNILNLKGINWNSTEQVLALFRTKGFKGKCPSKFKGELGDLYREYMHLQKLCTSYGANISNCIEGDRIRSTYIPMGATGRMSCKNPNIQSIPAETDYRRCFLAPHGHTFIISDFKNADLSVIAHLSQEPLFVKSLSENWDLHSIAGSILFPYEWQKGKEAGCLFHTAKKKCKCPSHMKIRDIAKTLQFAVLYGLSIYKFAEKIGLSVAKAQKIYESYFSKLPRVTKVLNYFKGEGLRKGYSSSLAPYYRRQYFEHWYSNTTYIYSHIKGIKYNKFLGEIERKAVNYPIQSTVANVLKDALRMLTDYDNIRIAGQQHDSIILIVNEIEAPYYADLLTKIMNRAALKSIPTGLLTAETTISNEWK